ncbi:MAG: DUF5020 family protein [Bacteroidales bacterium]
MRKFTLLSLLLLIGLTTSFAQKLELHYDYLSPRKYFTSTLTDFIVDKLGNTFYFVDFNYDNNEQGHSMSLAYFEIHREIALTKKGYNGIKFHIEYNDGFLISSSANQAVGANMGFPLNRVWVLGLGYPIKIGKNITLDSYIGYRASSDSDNKDAMVSTAWFNTLFKNKLIFTGFIDVWSRHFETEDKRKLVFLSEPQLWYQITPKFAAGGEVELSYNFTGEKGFKAYPTVGLRYVLK